MQDFFYEKSSNLYARDHHFLVVNVVQIVLNI